MSPPRLKYYLASIPTLLRGVRNWPAAAGAMLGLSGGGPFVVELLRSRGFDVRQVQNPAHPRKLGWLYATNSRHA